MIQTGDFIEIDYTGKIKEESMVFDTTIESIGKENGLKMETDSYKPVIICVGQHQLIKGIDSHLVGKEIGKKYSFVIPPEEGFGKKRSDHIQLIPTARFRKENINPVPGLQINVDNMVGTVKTVTGGRTLVDFNHPLSGKDLEYDVQIKRKVEDKKLQIESLLELWLHQKNIKVTLTGETANVGLPLPEPIAKEFSKKIEELTKVKEVIFESPKKGKDVKDPTPSKP